jgi:hypothetical protein
VVGREDPITFLSLSSPPATTSRLTPPCASMHCHEPTRAGCSGRETERERERERVKKRLREEKERKRKEKAKGKGKGKGKRKK